MTQSTVTHHPSVPFYVTGGTLSRDALSYVTRQADDDLYSGLTQGQFCYVLTSRQMGKSSLMVRTAARLRETGAGVVLLDLTAIGQNLTAEQWYSGLLTQIGQQLELDDELEEFWDAHPKLGPLQRWMQAIRHILLPRYPGPVVIFVDEIDAVRSLPFSTDEFFAAIREFYNRRTEDEELRRLTFCLLGVASPSDLIRDTRTTPFNVGRRIELHDFTAAEAAPLVEGLGQSAEAAGLLNRILYWTNGHPYLTQRLCQAVAEEAERGTTDEVDRLCRELFLTHKAQERDDNLLFVRERMLRTEGDLASLLSLYAQVRRGKRVRDDVTNLLISILRLSGVARVTGGYLGVRNRIYELVFDQEWVKTNMPDAELRRRRVAYRQGLLRATAIAALVLTVVISLAFVAVKQRNLANRLAQQAQRALSDAERQGQAAEERRQEAERQRGIAENRQAEAEQQRKIAEAQRQEANRQREIAEEQWAKYEQQRKIAEQRELSSWEWIKDTANPDILKGYLDTYPSGKFNEDAEQKYTTLITQRLSTANFGTVTSGGIAGRVYDVVTRMPISGAQVTAINQETGLIRSTISDKHGVYQFRLLTYGIYTIKFTHDEYKSENDIHDFKVRISETKLVLPPQGGLRKIR